MNSWTSNLRPALLGMALLTLATGVAYPFVVWSAGNAFFPAQVNGSLVYKDGKPVGSRLLAQASPDSLWFQPRPSAAGSGYAGESSSGSNAGPLTRTYVDSVVPSRVAAYIAHNGLPAGTPVPGSAVSASGSGLDPDITLRDALLQAPRVARARGIPVARVTEIVRAGARDSWWHPEPLRPVNVLELNLALEGSRGR